MLINPASLRTLTPSAVARAVALSVESTATPRQYHVSGGAEPHWADLSDPVLPGCDMLPVVALLRDRGRRMAFDRVSRLRIRLHFGDMADAMVWMDGPAEGPAAEGAHRQGLAAERPLAVVAFGPDLWRSVPPLLPPGAHLIPAPDPSSRDSDVNDGLRAAATELRDLLREVR